MRHTVAIVVYGAAEGNDFSDVAFTVERSIRQALKAAAVDGPHFHSRAGRQSLWLPATYPTPRQPDLVEILAHKELTMAVSNGQLVIDHTLHEED